MTRPTDAHKEYKSWVVESKNNKLVIVQSHWAPGYTDAHKATPEEAAEYAINNLQKSITELAGMLQQLQQDIHSMGIKKIMDEIPKSNLIRKSPDLKDLAQTSLDQFRDNPITVR